MEIILNELSLSGQFESIQLFIDTGLRKLLGAIKDIRQQDSLFKKYDFYNYKVTEKLTIRDVLQGKESRTYDELRRFKIFLSRLFEEPYWEMTQKHSNEDDYIFEENNVTGYSLAESCERDSCVISFLHPNYKLESLTVSKNNHPLSIHNITDSGQFINVLWSNNLIDISTYCNLKYNSKSKLDFSKIDLKEGFDLLKDKSDAELYLAAFQKLDSLSWQEIIVDDALDYKAYKNKKEFKSISFPIFKFRTSQKYRCFGYNDNGVFYVLCFDLTHKLSDKG